jgi:TPR repeat protein
MSRITFSAPAAVYSGDPAAAVEVRDAETLRQLHGMHSGDAVCSAEIDQQLVQQLGLTGGRLRFAWDADSGRLRITTTYGVQKKPDDEQLEKLCRETLAQWREGIGQGEFFCFRGELVSLQLAKSLTGDPDDSAEPTRFMVDACPEGTESAITVQWSDTGGPDDFLLHDLQQAAEEGHPEALTTLAAMYMDGDGVDADPEAAVVLLTRCAEQQQEEGLLMLADALLEGRGVERRPQWAIALLEKAAAAGSVLATARLADVYKQGEGVDAAPERAIPLLEQAAGAGFLPAVAELADCYEFGYGVPVNREKAQELYEFCMEQGFEDVAPALQRLLNWQQETEYGLEDEESFGGFLGLFRRQKESEE